MLHCNAPVREWSAKTARLGGRFEFRRRFLRHRLGRLQGALVKRAARGGQHLDDLDDSIALGQHFMVGAVGGFEIDPATQRVTGRPILLKL